MEGNILGRIPIRKVQKTIFLWYVHAPVQVWTQLRILFAPVHHFSWDDVAGEDGGTTISTAMWLHKIVLRVGTI